MPESLFKNVAGGYFIKKETLAQLFSCEFCKIFKNTFFNRTPLVAASELGGVKKAKSNKTEKPEELMAGYQEAECLWNVLSSSYKDKLTVNGLNKPKQKVRYIR